MKYLLPLALALLCPGLAQAIAATPTPTAAPAQPTATQPAETFLPAGALQYEEIRLDNGMRIVVQRAHSAPYVSARLVIKTGTDHFSCETRELPHLVEHLLFSANADMEEGDIDDQVNSWGGAINAFTYAEQTDVVLDAHAQFQAEAMQLLATMIAGFAPDDADVAREADVVERESGILHTPLRLWWSAQPVTHLAGTRFAIAAGIACGNGVPPVHNLRGEDVRAAFATYYVPANMMLVIAGDISDAGLDAARSAFAALPARPAPALHPLPVSMPAGNDFESGWLSGTANLDAPSAMGISPFHDWEGYYALLLVESWLNDRMFRELRSERGIAYTPSATVNYHGTALSITLEAQTNSVDTAFTRDYLRDLVTEVQQNGISESDFEHLRRATLLGMAQSFERISDRADYLAASVREIESGGLFQTEDFYSRLDYARFRVLLARDWPARFVVVDNSPRISWSARVWLLGGSVLLLCTGLALLVWRRLRDVRPG